MAKRRSLKGQSKAEVTLEALRGDKTAKESESVYTKYPFFGLRQIATYLRREGTVVDHDRVRRLIAKTGLEAIDKRPEIVRLIRSIRSIRIC